MTNSNGFAVIVKSQDVTSYEYPFLDSRFATHAIGRAAICQGAEGGRGHCPGSLAASGKTDQRGETQQLETSTRNRLGRCDGIAQGV